jgi:hypothetical protein
MVRPGRTPRPMVCASAFTASPVRVRRDALARLLDWQGGASDHKDDMAALVPLQQLQKVRMRAARLLRSAQTEATPAGARIHRQHKSRTTRPYLILSPASATSV